MTENCAWEMCGITVLQYIIILVDNAENSDLITIDTSEGISTLASEGDDGHGHGAEKADGHDDHSEHSGHDHHDDHDDGHKEAGSGHSEHADEAHAHDDHAEETHSAEAHAEGEVHAEADEHGADAEQAHGGHEHAHGEFDPHIWLDPKRAIEQVENIRDGLIEADPEGEAEYTANAATFIANLQELDAEITATLSPFTGQTFVVFHDFAAYFANSYGMDAEVFVGLPEENPSPEDVKRVIEAVQAEGLKSILTEPQAGESTFNTIAQDLNVGVSVFDSLEIGEPDAVQPQYYLDTMRQNANNLAASFEGAN